MGGAVFRPDVIVRGTDRPLPRLAVGIRTRREDLTQAARQLRQYMVGEACPLGLLVTPERTHVYQKTYSDTPDSIQELAVVETPGLLDTRGVLENGPELESAVRRWLEALVRHPGVAPHRAGEAARVEMHLLPAMVDAEVTVVGFR
jgi:hypothetical protein